MDYAGKYIHFLEDGVLRGGICEYAGYNQRFPEWGFTVICERCMFYNIDPSTIEIKPLPISWKGSKLN